jgi:hypothetical protein
MTIQDALKSGDLGELCRMLETVDDINQLDDSGWTLLNWAAGQGNLEAVKLLVSKGADVFRRGRDNRTPYLIALAAGHVETVRFLQTAEEQSGGDSEFTSSQQRERRSYCKAYMIGALRQFHGWDRGCTGSPASANAQCGDVDRIPDDEIVFLHQDHSVTRSAMHGQDVIFSVITPEWRSFCRETLSFRVPTDLELLINA